MNALFLIFSKLVVMGLKIIESIGEALIRTKLEAKHYEIMNPKKENSEILIQRQIEHAERTLEYLKEEKKKIQKGGKDDSNKK